LNAEGRMEKETKPRIAFFQLGDCGGDELEFLNLYERALDLLKRASLVQSTLLGLKDDGPYDIALVEGAVASEEDVKNLRDIRAKSKILIALGSCATVGGLPGLKLNAKKEGIQSIYGNIRLKNPPIEHLGPLDLYVKVDYYLHGCPVNREELLRLLKGLLESLEIRQGAKRFPFFKTSQPDLPGSLISLIQDKCILCNRCVEICSRVVSAIGMANRGFHTIVSTPFKLAFDESACIGCGLCTVYCPAAAMVSRDDTGALEELLSHKGKDDKMPLKAFVEVEAAAAIGEAFGLEGVQMGRLASALRLLGFDEVRIISWKQRIMRMELPVHRGEGKERKEKEKENDAPILIPCSEAARKFIKNAYPELLGRMAEAPNIGIDDLSSVLITPCLSRKIGSRIPVLTTREAIRLIRSRMEFRELVEGKYEVFSEQCGKPGSIRIIQGIPSIREELESILAGRSRGEILALFICPDGCLGGGGQPPIDIERMTERKARCEKLESLLA